jgi:hypothetical protein
MGPGIKREDPVRFFIIRDLEYLRPGKNPDPVDGLPDPLIRPDGPGKSPLSYRREIRWIQQRDPSSFPDLSKRSLVHDAVKRTKLLPVRLNRIRLITARALTGGRSPLSAECIGTIKILTGHTNIKSDGSITLSCHPFPGPPPLNVSLRLFFS